MTKRLVLGYAPTEVQLQALSVFARRFREAVTDPQQAGRLVWRTKQDEIRPLMGARISLEDCRIQVQWDSVWFGFLPEEFALFGQGGRVQPEAAWDPVQGKTTWWLKRPGQHFGQITQLQDLNDLP